MTSLEVRCARCAGVSAVEAEHRALPAWACPFCGDVNPMPPPAEPEPPPPHQIATAPETPPAPSARREPPPPVRTERSPAPIVATAILVLVVVVSLAVQADDPRPGYRTTDGILAALADRGLYCRDVRPAPSPAPPAREDATCVLGAANARIVTFADSERRDRFLAAHDPTRFAAGETWIVMLDRPQHLAAVARALGGVAAPAEE